jgi:hypothetical protein
MKCVNLISLILDIIGFVFISWYLFSIPKPLKFVFDSPYGIITDLQPIADAINNITRDFDIKINLTFHWWGRPPCLPRVRLQSGR